MHCPNINSPQWKSLVNKIGENNAWREFLKYGDAVYDRMNTPDNVVDTGLKSVDILQSPKAAEVFAKGEKNKWSLDKILTELQVPKDQIELLKQYNITDREQLITNMLADYSYTVEINITKTNINTGGLDVRELDDLYVPQLKETFYFSYRDGWFKENNNQDRIIATPEELKIIEEYKNKDATENSSFYSNLIAPGGIKYRENEIATPAITPSIKGHAQFATDKGIGWFRSDDKLSENVKADVDYQTYGVESGIAGDEIPGTRNTKIVPKDKFNYNGNEYEKKEPLFDEEDYGKISYFKNGKVITSNEFYSAFDAVNQPTKTRRILEVQSDLFQKGRDREDLVGLPKQDSNRLVLESEKLMRDYELGKITIEEYNQKTQALVDTAPKKDVSKNQFLQLLNKDNNWVTFFIKSIIQDSAKKGYEKVLFPTGATAYKIESGGSTIEDFIKNKEDRLVDLEKNLESTEPSKEFVDSVIKIGAAPGKTREQVIKELKANIAGKRHIKLNEINQLKKEIEDAKAGASGLAATAKFYETTVANVLKKQGYSPVQITDEHGNTWNEITISQNRDNNKVLLSIKTKSTEQISKGINKKLIRSEQEIKYTNFIQALVVNKLGDISPNKRLEMSPDDAFKAAKTNFEQAIKNVNDFIAIIKTPENFNALKARDEDRLNILLGKFYLQNVSSFEEAIKAKENYENIVNNFNRYRDFVTIELAHKGIKIKKGKFEIVQQDDVDNKEQDDTEDVSLANEEISKERFDRSIFETNPRDTASVRVKALIQTIRQMKYDEKTDKYSPEYEMGIPLYADGDDVFLDMLEAGIAMDLSGYTDTSSKLNAFRDELGKRKKARPYLDDLLSKINKYEQLGQWDKLNDILTVASKAFANETLVLYTLNKVGNQIKSVKLVKVIASNRDTIEGQVSRDWLTRHMVSGFYDKTAEGKLMLNADKVAQLNRIRLEGKSATGDAQMRKFIEYFDLLGIKFTDKDLKYIAPILHKKDNLNKGKNFGAVFNDGNLLANIHESFVNNLSQPFEGQYGFQNEQKNMKVLAKLYNDANPGLYKPASSKTADNKSKYLYIQPNYVEVAKREFDNGNTTNVTNTALAKPNQSFWTKVKNEIYKFVIGYFNGSREQQAGKDGKVRKNFTEKEQVVIGMFMKHQENMNDGTYITFTLSDKTTTMETKMTKEFFVDTDNNPIGKGEDFAIKNGKIEYTPKLKDKIYNSFVEPEISRILAAIKNGDKVNLENYSISSKLLYFFPVLNSDPSLENFRKDLYSGKKTIEELNKQYGQAVADVVLSQFDAANDEQVKYLLDNKIIEKEKGVYTFPLFSKNYVNRFREASIPNELLPKLMVLDMQLNYQNAQIKTVQFLKFDPAHAFKAYKGFDKSKSFDALSGEEKVKLVNTSWDEFSKRAASLIAPGGQGNWAWEYDIKFNEKGDKISSKKYNTQNYRSVTLKDVKRNIAKYENVETTDAQEFVTMQEHIDYLMSQGKLPSAVWESIHAKIVKAGPGGYYELNPKELGYVFSPVKPVYVNSAKEGEDTGLNRFDYIKTSRYPLIPQHEAGSERDKLRIWMEKNNVQSANFGSGKKLGRPSASLEVFDKDNNFIEPKDFDKSIQVLSRDGLRNQQEIPHQKDEIANVSQMNRTLFDGLLKSTFTFSGMKDVTGGELKTLKEAIRARQFQLKANELTGKLGGSVWKTERGLYELLKYEILNDTTGSYTENDLKSIELDDDDMFRIPLEAQFKFPKFQGLVNSMINNNVKLKVEGTSFVQVSAVGAKFTFSDLSEGIKSDIVWTDSYAKQFKKGNEVGLKYIEKKGDVVSPAQVIVSQYIRDAKGNLIDLSKFITEKNINGTTVKILDTSKMSEDLFQLVASRIPNQSHVSTLPIEVVGFLPSYMENTIIVPDGITGQMGSDFDVDKLFAYTSKVVENKDEEGNITYGPVQYTINSIADINNLNADQLGQAYRDLHWNVLTHPDTFDKITKSVDNPEVGDKKEEREQQLKKYNIDTTKSSNLPLDFMTSIRRFTDNKSGKDGVSIFANLISAQADMQDKILTLATKDKDGKLKPLPIKIKLSKNATDAVDLLYVGKTGESTSFIGKKRSISDNLNIEFTESVDNAKNQNLSAFNWDNKSMGAVGFLSMLTDEQGQAVPIEFMMDLTSQPAIKRLLTLIDLKQDSFGTYDSKAILNSIEEIRKEIIVDINKRNLLKVGETAEGYFNGKENPSRNTILDPQTLADMWVVGQAIQQKDEQKVKESLESIRKDLNTKYGDIYQSIDDLLLDYYNTQYNALDLYYDVEDKGRELMTILGAVYPYTKGIGSNMFDTKQKLNQLNKLADSSNFIGIENLAGEVEKDKETGRIMIMPKGELGAAIRHSLMVAQDMYAKIFPIASGKTLEDIVVKILENQGLKIDDISKNKYSSTFENIFYSAIDFLYTSPDLELFDNAKEIRNRLINGDTSIGKRIVDLKEKPEFARNGFLKYIEVNTVNNSDAYTIAFREPFGTNVNEKSVVSGFYELATSDTEEIRQLAKDIAVYTYATGDAGNIGRFVPIDYYLKDKDYAKAIKKIRGTFVDSMSDAANREALIDQIVQNNPEEFAKKFNYSSSVGQNGDTDNTFKKILKPLLKGADSLEKVSKFSLKLGNFLADEKAEGIANSLQIPLSPSEITAAKMDGLDVYKVDDKGNPILDANGKAIPKSKYPPYILITDSYEGIDYFSSRTADYLYKRTSKAVTGDGIATYERINILGVGNIKEFEFNNPELTSVIKNNNIEGVDVSMLSDEPDMSLGLTPDMFEDYSIKPTTENARTIYAKLGDKTQSESVILPKDLIENTTYTVKNFWDKIVPEARDMYDDKISNKTGTRRPMLVAYRGNSKKTFLQNYKNENTIGNPFDWQVETGTRDEQGIKSTKRFIHWMITGDNMGTTTATPEYRQAIIDDIKSGKIVDSPILYYQEKGYATHATALDYLINKYDWNAPKPAAVESENKPGPVAVKIFKWNRQSAEIGTDADIAMRKIATASIVEFKSDKVPSSSLTTMSTVGEDNSYSYDKDRYVGVSNTGGLKNGRVNFGPIVMLARNGKLSGTALSPDTISEINEAHKQGSKFLVGDMEGVDTPFIDHLNKIGATYAIYGHGRLKGVSDVEKVAPKTSEPVQQSTEQKGNKINIYSTDKNGFQDLSNFAERPFVVNGITFSTVEHAYQWSKGNYYNTGAIDPSSNETPEDQEVKVRKHMANILAAKTGAEAKALGRRDIDVEFEKEMWDEESSGIMKMLIQKSFEQNPEAAAKLLSTGNAELTHTQESPKSKWRTEFPKLLMEVREELKNTQSSTEDTEEPITVDYGGKTYILEGSIEDGFNVYNTSKGQKSKIVADNNLKNKVLLTHAVSLFPERVVTLNDMQHQPSYYINFDNSVIALSPSNYGGKITSDSIYNKVMSVYKNKTLVPTQDEPVAKNPEVVKYEPNYIEVNGKKIETFKWDKSNKIAITLTNDQKKAVKLMIDHFTSKPGVPFILKGKAGTGKTTVIRVINEYFKGKSSVIITPTHKAGKNASIVTYGNTQDKYKTYHSTFEGNRPAPNENILIFDEISMLNDTNLTKVMKKIKPSQMVVFMGDQRQLPPVKESKVSAFFNSKDGTNAYELTEVMRFDQQGSIFKIADRYAENLKRYDVIKQFPEKLISDKDAVYTVDSSKRLVDAYIHYYRLEGNDPSKVRLIVYGNKTAELYNNQIRNIIYKGNAQFGVINDNDLLTGNAGWSTKNVLQSPMVNSSEYKVIEEPKIVKRSYGGFSFLGQGVTYKEIVSGEFEAERSITVIDPTNPENKQMYNHIACNIINMKNTKYDDRYESSYNEELNRIEKSGIYSLTTMYAKPSVIDPTTKRVLSVDLYTLDQLLTIIKKENPELSEDEALNMIDSEVVKQYYKIEPNVSFGYAITTHKSQGSTYKHVLVDEANMSFRDKTRRVDDQDDEFYAYEANQMRYVGFSRPTTTLVIYTKKAIGDTLEYNEGDSSNLTEDQPTNAERIDIFSLFQGSMVDDLTTEVFGSPSSRLDARGVLNKIYAEGDELSKNILSLIGKAGGFGNLKIVVDENLGSHGEYLNGVITINPSETIGSTDNEKLAKKRLHDVIVHELLHHITSTLLNTNNFSNLTIEQRKWVVSLNNLFTTVQDKFLKDPAHRDALLNAIEQSKKTDGFLSENDKSMYYGLTNVDDFVSMLMTDEGFRELMNNTKYEGYKSILDRFIDILAKILESLGVKVKNESVLKEGITNIIGLIQSRNRDAQAEENPTLKSISTAKESMISDNFEEILNILNIKSEC